jgi:choline dehydrogenase
VSIRSDSPFDKVIVDPNYLSNPNDLKKLVRGVRLSMNIVHSKAFGPMVDLKANPTDKKDYYWGGDVDPDTITDEEVAAFVKKEAESMYHPVGTARIGVDEKDSVVSPDLKVHGIHGLRIVDASIFPSQISGHPVSLLSAGLHYLSLPFFCFRLRRSLPLEKRLR